MGLSPDSPRRGVASRYASPRREDRRSSRLGAGRTYVRLQPANLSWPHTAQPASQAGGWLSWARSGRKQQEIQPNQLLAADGLAAGIQKFFLDGSAEIDKVF